MADAVGLSRDRFYELVKAGVFPEPARDLQTRRPLYPPELQEICQRVRATGIGCNGRKIIFYNTRRGRAARSEARRRYRPRPEAPLSERLLAELQRLGVKNATEQRIRSVISTCFPQGVEKIERVELLRRLVRELWGS